MDSADWVEESLDEIKVPSHEDILLYLQEQKYRQECAKNEKRNIRRKAKYMHWKTGLSCSYKRRTRLI